MVRVAGPTPDKSTAAALGKLIAQLATLRSMSLSIAGMLQEGYSPNNESAVVKDLGTRYEQDIPVVSRQLFPCEPELEAVLAHEIGHFKKKHIPRMLMMSTVGSLVGFYCLSLLAREDWLYRSFGLAPGNITPALLLFGLLSGLITFWFSPLAHWWSRRYEYQADAFAAKVMDEPRSLIGALRKLNEKNLSNLTPHPLYSGFYYSHPTLLERERALEAN